MFLIQLPCNLHISRPVCHLAEDAPDDFSFFLDDFHVLVLVSACARDHLSVVTVAVDDLISYIPTLEAHLVSESDVAGNAAALLLCYRAESREDELAGRVGGIKVLFFKKNRRIALPQSPQRGHEIRGVSGKPGNGLAHHPVNLALPTVPHQTLETRPLIATGAGDPVVGIDADGVPVRVVLDQLIEIPFLGFIGILLVG